MRIRMPGRPLRDADGAPVFLLPKLIPERNQEQIICTWLMCQSALFGTCYRILMPDFFEEKVSDSGVTIGHSVVSHEVLPTMSFPGDIDLLVIPYRGDELLIDRTLAIEVKIVRAKFQAQGKSPNDFGFSQARGLLRNGFPYVGVAHLIMSDRSPTHAWRSVLTAEVIDGVNGVIGELKEVYVDMMPADLIERSFGRLKRNCSSELIGLLSAYVEEDSGWQPGGKGAVKNPDVSLSTLDGIARYYARNFVWFRELPRFPPGWRF